MEKYRISSEVQKIIDKLPIAVAIYQLINNKVLTVFVSQSCVRLLGFTDKAEAYYVLDNDMYRDVHPDDVGRSADQAYRFAVDGSDKDIFNSVYRNKTASQSEWHLIHSVGKHVQTPDGTRLAVVCYLDETEAMHGTSEHSEKDLLNHLREHVRFEMTVRKNNYDDLTGLPKMTYFLQLATAWRSEIVAHGKEPVMLYFDISELKFFNHHYGFSEGDHLIRSLSLLLRKFFGAENSGRFGEDHFAVFTDGENITKRLDAFFAEWQQANHQNILPLRVGIYRGGFEEVSASVACDRAKFACDTERNMDGSSYVFFDQRMRDAMDSKEYVLNHFEHALQDKWIIAYFQPIVWAKDGSLCNEEALARWDDPNLGLLAPYKFISVLEDAGLLYKIDLYMVDRIIDYQLAKRKRNLPLVPISVNLSERDFLACDMTKEITKRLTAAGLTPKDLIIEITERSIGEDPDLLGKVMDEFHAAGYSIWLDDFGSEYSSLNVLQDYQFELIKLDMKFLKKVSTNSMSRLIIESVLELAKEAQIETISEGVETVEQAEFLRAAGCLKLQGYLYGKPAPPEERLQNITAGKV